MTGTGGCVGADAVGTGEPPTSSATTCGALSIGAELRFTTELGLGVLCRAKGDADS